MERTVAGYALGRPLGKGGMGQVFEARRADHPGPVALKLLPPGVDPRAMQRLLREGELLTRLAHSNVIRVFEVGISQGQPFITMEMLDGLPLSAVLAELSKRRRLPSPGTVAELARGMARGLYAAHDLGVLHRDIKPSNVVVTREGRVVVLDFGIALEGDVSRLTSDGEVTGTPAYLSPEQILGEELDVRSDIYQFGLILHELLTLARPFPGKKAAEIMTARMKSDPPSVRSVFAKADENLAALTDACLKRAKDQRPATFEAVLERLRATATLEGQLSAELSGLMPEPVETVPAAAPAPPPPVAPPLNAGEWSLEERLGQGGMGAVYKARRARDGAQAAVKLIHPHLELRDDALRRFGREIRIASKLEHPNLVRVLDSDTTTNRRWYAMELVRGSTLAERLVTGKPTLADAARWMKELLSAVAVLHNAGLIHRDIKPANLMIDSDGRLRLMDLGLVGGEELTRVTRTGQALGTPLYMPPESIDGEHERPGDLYQIGLVLHELVTGNRQFPTAVAPDPPPELAKEPALAALYRALLRSDPTARPAEAGAAIALFSASGAIALAGVALADVAPTRPRGPAARPPSPSPSPVSPHRPPATGHAPPAPRPPAPHAPAPNVVLRTLSALGTTVKYGLVALTILIAVSVIAILPSLISRFSNR